MAGMKVFCWDLRILKFHRTITYRKPVVLTSILIFIEFGRFPVCSDIMRLSNELVYKGALRCGSEAVAEGRLVLTDNTVLQSAPTWLQEALKPDNRIIFLDTSKVSRAKQLFLSF